MKTTMSTKKQREVTVLVRYEIKEDVPSKGLHKGDVVLYVENDQGTRYYTTLRRNKAHSCSCVGNAEHGKRCYHIKQMAARENARQAAKTQREVFVFSVGGKEARGATAAEALYRALQLAKHPVVAHQLSPLCQSSGTEMARIAA